MEGGGGDIFFMKRKCTIRRKKNVLYIILVNVKVKDVILNIETKLILRTKLQKGKKQKHSVAFGLFLH